MDKPTDLVEFEVMVFSRHVHLRPSRARHGGDGRLDRSAYILLRRLSLSGPMSIGQLGDAFGLDVSTLNRQTAAMLRAGLVERIPDPEGGIARKFRVTEEGERLLEADRSCFVGGLERVLADWTPEEVAGFLAYLRRFNHSVEQLEGRPWPRP